MVLAENNKNDTLCNLGSNSIANMGIVWAIDK